MASARDYLLDTGILILYARASKAGQAIEEEFHLRASPFKPMVCAVTLGEARAFARHRNWGQEKLRQLEDILRNVVSININLPEVMEAYAEIDAWVISKGWTIGDNDTWIAAAARSVGATLLTTDRDFDPLHGEYIDRIYVDPQTGKMARD